MNDEFRMTLNSPLTKEDWAKITDTNMEHTKAVTFQTEGGEKVEFIKVVRCEDCKYYEPDGNPKRCGGCLAHDGGWLPNEFCAHGKRKEV